MEGRKTDYEVTKTYALLLKLGIAAVAAEIQDAADHNDPKRQYAAARRLGAYKPREAARVV